MQIVKNIQADGAGALAVSAALLDHMVERVIAPLDGIVAAAQAGSPAAFGELHSIYSGRLYHHYQKSARRRGSVSGDVSPSLRSD